MTAAPHTQRRALLIYAGAVALAGGLPDAVRAAATPARVIVAGGALTEIVYALNAQARIVGTDTTSAYPPAARATPKVGYLRALSAEGVLSLRPDLLIASAEAGPPAALRQMSAAGLRVMQLPHGFSASRVAGNMLEIADALGAAQTGSQLAARFEHDWQTTAANVRQRYAAPDAKRPRVLFILGHTGNQTLVSGQGTAADAMLTYAGAQNALQGFKGYRPLTPEAAVAAAPDFILTTTGSPQDASQAAALLSAPGLPNTPAGRQRRIVALDALYLLGFGPRLPQAVAELAARLHPR